MKNLQRLIVMFFLSSCTSTSDEPTTKREQLTFYTDRAEGGRELNACTLSGGETDGNFGNEIVFIGTIERYKINQWLCGKENLFSRSHIELKLNVETNVYGTVGDRTIDIYALEGAMNHLIIKPGQRLLVSTRYADGYPIVRNVAWVSSNEDDSLMLDSLGLRAVSSLPSTVDGLSSRIEDWRDRGDDSNCSELREDFTAQQWSELVFSTAEQCDSMSLNPRTR